MAHSTRRRLGQTHMPSLDQRSPPGSPSPASASRGRITRVASAIKGLFKGKRNSFTESESEIDQFDVVNPSAPAALALGRARTKDRDKSSIPRRGPSTQPNTPHSPRTRVVRRARSHAALGEGTVGRQLFTKSAEKKQRREAFVLEGQTFDGFPLAELSNHEKVNEDLRHLLSTEIRYKPAIATKQVQAESSRAGTLRVKRVPPPVVPPELELGSYGTASTLTLVDDPFGPTLHPRRRAEHANVATSTATVPKAASHYRSYGRI